LFEARAKSFSGYSSQKTTRKLSSILTHHFYNLAKKTTATTFLVDTYLQKGKNFGERISNAFADVYAKGFDNVICIGNDCLELSLAQLEIAISQTEIGKVILGPTADGGTYLMGIPKAYFNQVSFSKIKWQTTQTFKNLHQLFLSQKANILETELLIDIDGEKDISSKNKVNSLIRLLIHFIQNSKTKQILSLSYLRSDLLYLSFPSLKGPPTLAI
jgi:glycosyltransferase A (GT-A) superfamily protein (DUF2064 family)